MKAEDFLIERKIIIKDAKQFPLNLSRDTHVQTSKDIIKAMRDFGEQAFGAGVHFATQFVEDSGIEEEYENNNPDKLDYDKWSE